jgi:hypothetical protein
VPAGKLKEKYVKKIFVLHPLKSLKKEESDPELSVTFKTPTRSNFFAPNFFAYYFLKIHLHHSSQTKIHKEVTKE